MVIPDLSAPFTSNQSTKPALATDRFLAGIFDLLLLVPIATFVPALHIRDARLDYLQGFESNIWYQIILLWVLSYIVIQTVFMYFTNTTPGGMIMHTRICSLNGPLTWNQCLMRSFFTLLSWVLVCLPFLEVITHPVKRAWHDRVSDTLVVDLKNKPVTPGGVLNVQTVRFFMILGIFFVMMSIFSVVTHEGDLQYLSDGQSVESTDSLVAQALLKKDFSEEMQNEVEERIWSTQRRAEKSIAYFFKIHAEKNPDVKTALADQICKWNPSDKSGSLCSLAKYSIKSDDKMLKAFAENSQDAQTLTSKVFLLKELTRNSQFSGAVKIYKQIKKQASLSDSFKDSLKIWDVSLFWALRENQVKGKQRMPASEDESEALREYIQERGQP